MTGSTSSHGSSLISRLRGMGGQTAILVAVSLVVLLGVAGLAVDFGYVLNARRILQTSSDAAATAAAQDLSDRLSTDTAYLTATSYSSVAGNKNAAANMPGVSLSVDFLCLIGSAGDNYPSCSNHPEGKNAVDIKQQVTLPLFWGRVLGRNSMTLTASARALMKGGTMPPLDVMIVLDTTGSMSGTPLAMAKEGIRTLLGVLWPCQPNVTCNFTTPAIDMAGLWIFPGVDVASKEFDCPNVLHPVVRAYNAGAVYKIVSLTNNYRTSTLATLNTGTSLVRSVDGLSGCTGIEAIGGFGSYFANAIDSANQEVSANGRPNVQDALIFISDGAASGYAVNTTTPPYQLADGCNAAVQSAHNLPGQPWIYSIRYYDPGSPGVCSNSSLNPHNTMLNIASDPSKFFELPRPASLVDTFNRIALDLLNTRIID